VDLYIHSPLRLDGLVLNFFPLALQPNSGLGCLHETFRFTSLLGRVISSSQGLHLYTNTEKCTHTTQTLNMYSLSGIRTHGPGVRASEDSSCFRPLGYRDRQVLNYLRSDNSS
jgi:hypothetical protein